jgi:hypothetical protein
VLRSSELRHVAFTPVAWWGGAGLIGHYEQPLVVPQLAHTKQAPARCMTMPHW